MSSILDYLQSPSVLALLISILIFFTTIFLVVKRWIGFSITLLLLLFSLTAGLMINHQKDVQHYMSSHSPLTSQSDTLYQDNFPLEIQQAIENLRIEIQTEKQNLQRVVLQVQEIFDSMHTEKEKLEHFIEETRKQFNIHSSENSSSMQESSLPKEIS